MKHILALALVLPCLVPVSLPTYAGGVEDLVRANCTKQIVSSTDVNRNAIKSFSVRKSGSGYVMSGQNEEHQTVTCETADDGRVTWVRVG